LFLKVKLQTEHLSLVLIEQENKGIPLVSDIVYKNCAQTGVGKDISASYDCTRSYKQDINV
jgi:hypothetical protein